MQMTLTTRGGETIYLPPSIAIDDDDQVLNVPGAVIPGRDGRRPYGHLTRFEPKVIRASGTVHEVSSEQAHHMAMALRSQIMGKGTLKLRRNAGDDRWIEVVCTSINCNPHRGHFGGRMATFRMTFQADDPFWYHSHLTTVDEEIEGLDDPVHLFETINIGDIRVDPIIWIAGRTVGGVHTVNPSLHNHSTGRVLAYTGELKEGEILILDPTSNRMAIKIPDNVEHSGTVQGGTTTTITLDSTASDSDESYVNQMIRITEGSGLGQIRRITGYSGVARTAMVGSEWDVIPDATSEYEIYRLPLDEPYWLYEGQWGMFSGGINAIADMNADYIVNGFPLSPGMNSVEVRGDTGHMKVSFIYRARWA